VTWGDIADMIRAMPPIQPASPSFETARPALEQDIIHAGAQVLMQEALKAAPVHYHGMAGGYSVKVP
jgi:hypothetical protein